jgi:fructuronate reductase
VNKRLHPSLLGQLNPGVQLPGYERSAHRTGIVHLGVGAFHRAHQAVYLDDLLARCGGDWRILGISCRGTAVRNRLAPQDFLYTVHERSASALQVRVVASIADVLVAAENPTAVTDAIACASTHVISLTITEKGYCRSAAGSALDLQHPDIVHDLAHPTRARSALGLLLEGLRQRRRHRVAPATLISCDNLPHNGAVLKQVLLDFARQRDAGLADWIQHEVACPSTMVDRIVPATTDADISAAASVMGLTDHALVKTEPFRQWIIEDRFAGARPDFELAGVRLVADVGPFELAKLRLLNGSHSLLAYLGTVADLTYVHEAIAEPDFLQLVRRLMHDELAPTLDAAAGLDLDAYQSALLARFANPALQHRLQQIAMDGSQKLPQRLLQPLRQRLACAQPFEVLALAIAAWMRYMLGRTEHDIGYELKDPLAARLSAIASAGKRSVPLLVGGLLAVTEIFGDDLANHPALVAAVSHQLQQLLTVGARETVRRLLKTP